MAYLDEAQKANVDGAVVFDGAFTDAAFADTAAVKWGTRYVKDSTGLYIGRMQVGNIVREIPSVIGAAPSRITVTITLMNHDGYFDRYLSGTNTTNPGSEYLSDSFLNLRGQLFDCVRAADGTIYKEELTGTLYCSGDPDYDGFLIRLTMSTVDEKTLGKSKFLFTHRQVKDSLSTDGVTPLGNGTYYAMDGTTGAVTQAQFDTLRTGFTEALDDIMPHVYGRNAFPLTYLGMCETSTLFSGFPPDGNMLIFSLSMMRFEPTNLSGFPSWRFYSSTFQEPEALQAHSGAKTNFILVQIERYVRNESGDLVKMWLVLVVAFTGYFVKQKITEDGEYTQVTETDIADVEFLLDDHTFYVIPYGAINMRYAEAAPSTVPGTPANIVQAIVGQHSEAGSGAVDPTTLARTNKTYPHVGHFGGRLASDASIAELIENVGKAAGLCFWTDTTNKIHMLPNQAFDADDKAAYDAGTLTHLRHVDVFGGWREEIPRGANRRGAACHRVTVEWPEELEKFWGSGIAVRRFRNATRVPLGALIEGDVPAAWVHAPRAVEVFSALSSRRSTVARRISFTTHFWLSTQPIGGLYLLSNPRGIAVETAGIGYFKRLVRLERTEAIPGERACRATFEDLGRVANAKPSVLDAISYWLSRAPVGNLTLKHAGSATLVSSGSAVFTAADVGRHLWVPGAANASNRLSMKITAYFTTSVIGVEAPGYTTAETVAASGAGWDLAWAIMDTQGSKGSSYRADKIRLCEESSGAFRDGVTAGFQLLGG
jgi:hypothetical protein